MRLLHAPTSLAARGFMRRRKKIQETRGSGAASSLLPFFAGGDLQNTLVPQLLYFFTNLDFSFFFCIFLKQYQHRLKRGKSITFKMTR